ncbi:tryptophan--tRNA ligase [bacterium]|nr:tryptophan--tRNA ligase [bacterium]
MKETLFSGIQPTGELHIGNYLGAIRNWVALQETYDCVYSVVDYHAITIEYDAATFPARIMNAVIMLLACGIDPRKARLFVQSHVPEHTELAWVFSSVTPMGELGRMTQFKEKSEQHRQNVNAGLFTYPVLQAADILVYKATRVPVGEDQVQHIELTREVARAFNARYGAMFPECQAIVSKARRILGLDGKAKMSKSLNNYLGLMESPEAMWEKLRVAVTDPARKRRSDPGNPDVCNVFTLHTFFSPPGEQEYCAKECRCAGIGCIDCKKILWKNICAELAPIQERARTLQADRKSVEDIIADGARRCAITAQQTMCEVRHALGVRW